MNAPAGKKRYRLLDAARGICVVSMVLYHLVYDIVHVLGINVPWWSGMAEYVWQQSICRGFILLAGASFCLSANTMRRGIIIFACGAVVSAVTITMGEGFAIRFGILTFMGAAYMITTPLRRSLEKLHPAVGAVLFAVLFAFTRNFPRGALGIDELALISLPSSLYSVRGLEFLGLRSPDFHSTDYFPLIPWFFLFIAGYFLWRLMRDCRFFDRLMFHGCPPIEWIGRHALIIYMVHQPVIYGAVMLIRKIR